MRARGSTRSTRPFLSKAHHIRACAVAELGSIRPLCWAATGLSAVVKYVDLQGLVVAQADVLCTWFLLRM